MTHTTSVFRRYTFRMLGSGVGYALTLLGATWILKTTQPNIIVAVALAIIPALFVLGMLVAIWKFLNEADEVQRFFVMRAMMLGLFAVLGISGAWGVFEMLIDDLPTLPVFWVFPIFFFVMGASQFLRRDQTCRS